MSFPTQPFAPNLLARLPEPPRKVVVLRASRIGDFICATPSLRALRRALPDAHITIIALPFVRELAERSPFLDDFVEFCGFPGIAEQFFAARTATGFLKRMQAEQFDLALQMHGTGVYSNPFALLLGAKATAGFIRRVDRPGLLNAALPMPSKGHEITRLLAFTSFLGAPSRDEVTDFPLTDEDNRAASDLLASTNPPLIGVHPYARDPHKCWPLTRFFKVADELRRRHGGTVVLIGSSDNRAASSAMTEAIGPPCRDLTGKTSVTVLGAVISQLSVLLTNDSAPAHVAYALGTPAVTVFIDTDPARWGPPRKGPFRVVRSLPNDLLRLDTAHPNDNETPGPPLIEEVVEAAEEVMREGEGGRV